MMIGKSLTKGAKAIGAPRRQPPDSDSDIRYVWKGPGVTAPAKPSAAPWRKYVRIELSAILLASGLLILLCEIS